MLVIQYIRINIDYLYKKIKKENDDMAYHRNPKYVKFTEETKRQAVQRVLNGETQKAVSEDIGCAEMTLRKWMGIYDAKL